MLYARPAPFPNESPVYQSCTVVCVAGVNANTRTGLTASQHSPMLRLRGRGTARAFRGHVSSETGKHIPVIFKRTATVTAGPLHAINEGIGDAGVSRVPQTLHTIDRGVSA